MSKKTGLEMVFNSLLFLVFFAIVLILHHLPFPWRVKKWNLWIASYVFYAAWNPPFVVLLWISTLTDWIAGKRLAALEKRAHRIAWLVISLSVNLGLLGYFKYGGFLLENFVQLLDSLGIEFQPAAPDVVLPVGISFYTFQSLSYTLDIYRRELKPWDRFSDFAMFVTFFPQLVAGPIVRAADFLPQLREPKRASGRQLGWGFSLLTVGLFEKVILADTLLAPVGDKVYGAAQQAGSLDAWIGTLAFSGQIFFDFSGYSNCAIGAAMCLGFVLPDNFLYPYGAVGFTNFWRRWHISLSTWLRDYLYISLGGNRKGTPRTLVNIMLTMLIGGLWHGASWRFVVWGGLHGVYLLAERGVRALARGRESLQRASLQFPLALVTYFFVCITWVFFRADDFSSAFTLTQKMFGRPGENLVTFMEGFTVLGINAALLITHWNMRNTSLEAAAGKLSWWLRAPALGLMLLALAFTPGEHRAFIYFQF